MYAIVPKWKLVKEDIFWVDRFFFPIASQAHNNLHPLEPYIGREPDAVAPKMTREKGWHHLAVS